MCLKYAIERLTYLKDNNADPEIREALGLAIDNLKRIERQNKLIKVQKDLAKINENLDDPKFIEKIEEATKDLQYPEHEWIPCTVEDLLKPLTKSKQVGDEFTDISIKNEDMSRLVRVLEDDGMGYGAFNSYAFTSEVFDNDFRLWI